MEFANAFLLNVAQRLSDLINPLPARLHGVLSSNYSKKQVILPITPSIKAVSVAPAEKTFRQKLIDNIAQEKLKTETELEYEKRIAEEKAAAEREEEEAQKAAKEKSAEERDPRVKKEINFPAFAAKKIDDLIEQQKNIKFDDELLGGSDDGEEGDELEDVIEEEEQPKRRVQPLPQDFPKKS